MAISRPQYRAALLLIAAWALAGAAPSQSTGGPYAISSGTIDAGGSHSSGGTFSVDGSVAQPIAGNALAGGQYSVESGFQQLAGDAIFSSGFE